MFSPSSDTGARPSENSPAALYFCSITISWFEFTYPQSLSVLLLVLYSALLFTAKPSLGYSNPRLSNESATISFPFESMYPDSLVQSLEISLSTLATPSLNSPILQYFPNSTTVFPVLSMTPHSPSLYTLATPFWKPSSPILSYSHAITSLPFKSINPISPSFCTIAKPSENGIAPSN